MCGIFGIVTQKNQQLGQMLLEAGRQLSYRGYDSVGCATLLDNGAIDLRKDVGKLETLNDQLGISCMQGRRGLIQLRWATFGSPTQINAQPHIDSEGILVGAHNGNVVNNAELRKQFIAEGMIVRSTNDGESCVHAVERYIKKGVDLIDACRMAYKDLAGDFAFVVGKTCEDRLCAIKKGSGLIVGIADGVTCVGSDLSSIIPFTNQVIFIQDGEMAILYPDRVEIRLIEDGCIVNKEVEIIQDTIETAQKAGFAHFMQKEIFEQPQVAGELIRLLEDSPNVLPIIERFSAARNLFLVGCGSSYHACMLGGIYLSCIAGIPAIPVLAPQFIAQYSPSLSPKDVALFVSQSGETRDVLIAEESARQLGVRTLGLINRIGSTLTRVCERYLPIACGDEISVPATKTFLNQAIAFLYLALHLADVPTTGLGLLPDLLNKTLQLIDQPILAIVDELTKWPEMYCLGFGSTYPIALEGALKIKQITYAHCEGLLSSEFKHGPLSAVHEDYPVLFVSGPENVHSIVSSLNEVACRGGKPIVIGEDNLLLRENAHHVIGLPEAGPLFNPLLAILPMQCLAYHLAIAKGLNPDSPRNLIKTITFN